MATYLERIKISSFRGIRDLHLAELRDVNIIAGDNNSGKTSILEAIALLRNPWSFYNVLKVARMREGVFAKNTLYNNFISMFSNGERYMELEASSADEYIHFQLQGKEERTINDGRHQFYKDGPLRKYAEVTPVEITRFVGELHGKDWADARTIPIDYSPLVPASSYRAESGHRTIVYVPPGAHLHGNVFNRIVQNEMYKEICIHMIQLFDEDIIDLLYLSNDRDQRAVEYVKHRRLGIMPLSTYGDGIKKVLSLANSIAAAAGGILLIDEIETSINYKYYNDIFSFLIKACRQYNVQMFITTHSIEAIDGILKTQDYDNGVEYEPISVLTFRKEEHTAKILPRTLAGKEVYFNRERFGFEVRL